MPSPALPWHFTDPRLQPETLAGFMPGSGARAVTTTVKQASSYKEGEAPGQPG